MHNRNKTWHQICENKKDSPISPPTITLFVKSKCRVRMRNFKHNTIRSFITTEKHVWDDRPIEWDRCSQDSHYENHASMIEILSS